MVDLVKQFTNIADLIFGQFVRVKDMIFDLYEKGYLFYVLLILFGFLIYYCLQTLIGLKLGKVEFFNYNNSNLNKNKKNKNKRTTK